MGSVGPGGPPGPAGVGGVAGPPGPVGPTGPTGSLDGVVTLREHTESSPGLGNGETFTVTATCDTPRVISGGYAIATPERPSDRGALSVIVNGPLNPQAWAVTLAASADTQAVVLLVSALCVSP